MNEKIIKEHGFSNRWRDIGIIVLLFVVALSLRLEFQSSSIPEVLIRADALQYFRVARNLYYYDVYSAAKVSPSSDILPATDFSRPPGYPLFLYSMIPMSKSLEGFVQRVVRSQAVLSACGIVLLFGICRLFFSSWYSFAVCLPAVLAPHLIAMDFYLLSESLFTFCSLLGIFFFILATKLQKKWYYLIAGFFFGYLVLIRPAALLFGPFLAVASALFFLRVRKPRELIVMVTLVIVGYTAVYFPYLAIRNHGTEKFAVSGQTIRDKIIMGADINLQHFMTSKRTPEFKSKMVRVNSDLIYAIKVLKEKVSSDLVGHLKWYLGGKLIYYWRWDNFYAGDVYQYPMQRRGFDENSFLKPIHRVMKVAHWPLFVLTLMGTVAVFIMPFVRKKSLNEEYLVVVPALVFFYYAVLFTILVPLPRYSIPVRPFSYILAVYAIKVLIDIGLSFKKTPPATLQA